MDLIACFEADKVGTVTCIVAEELARSVHVGPSGGGTPLRECVCVRRDVTCRAAMEAVVADLTRGWEVVKTASDVRKPARISAVTLQGDILARDGEVRGGSAARLFPREVAISCASSTTAVAPTSAVNDDDVAIASCNASIQSHRRDADTLRPTYDYEWRQKSDTLRDAIDVVRRELAAAERDVKAYETLSKQKMKHPSVDVIPPSEDKLAEQKKQWENVTRRVEVNAEELTAAKGVADTLLKALTKLEEKSHTAQRDASAAAERCKVLGETIAKSRTKFARLKESVRVTGGDEKAVTKFSLDPIAMAKLQGEWVKARAETVAKSHTFHMLSDSVNMSSLRRDFELSSRLDALAREQDDAIETLTAAQTKLEDVLANRLRIVSAALRGIDEVFRAVLTEIAGPGVDGRLVYGSGTALFEGGCHIVVRTPHTVEWREVSTLSGGQRAVISVSLLFALQQRFPSPFYLFDEVDAALDAVHVIRLGTYIHRHDLTTQFICISLRYQMYEKCRNVIGVYHVGGSSVAIALERGSLETTHAE